MAPTATHSALLLLGNALEQVLEDTRREAPPGAVDEIADHRVRLACVNTHVSMIL